MDSDPSIFMEKLKDYFSKYDRFVRLNPRLAAEVEAIIRWSSYLIATKKSPVLGELLSSGANLLQLCNDLILRQANPELKVELYSCATQLKTFLSVLQSLELLAEIYARDNYGPSVKWAIITVIQITKAAIKLILLIVFDEGISQSQSLVPLDRIHLGEIVKLQEKFPNVLEDVPSSPEEENEQTSGSRSLVLPSSGRKMRSIHETRPKSSDYSKRAANSTETPIDRLQKQRLIMLLQRYREHRSAKLTETQIYGELLHISRPIAHLALMGTFGTKSWLSFFTSLAMDISSLYLIRTPLPLPNVEGCPTSPQNIPRCYQFNLNERMELGQRASSLLLYLLRSPFFDEYTKQRALEGISTAAENIPLVGSFLATFINYIPDWQKDYFRVWSS